MTRYRHSVRRTVQVRATLAVLMLGLLSFTMPASAKQYLVFNTVAFHFENADERRLFTPGVGWEFSPSSRIGFHAGTLSDSFGYQAGYAGLNYATRKFYAGPIGVRFIGGASIVHKQFHKNSEPETKILPLPVMEIGFNDNAVLNISGSPKLDYAGQKNNAVVFLQFKLNFN